MWAEDVSRWRAKRNESVRINRELRGDLRAWCARPGCTEERAFGCTLCESHSESAKAEAKERWRQQNREKARRVALEAQRRWQARNPREANECKHGPCKRARRRVQGACFCAKCAAVPARTRRLMASRGRGIA